MKNDNMDNMIYDYFNKIEPPMKFNNISKQIPTKSIYKKNKYLLKISTVCALLLMICTVAFGKDIYMYILDSVARVHEGVATAVNNDYVSEINMDYVESNGINIKVDYILMDDFNLFLVFDIIYNTDMNIDKIKFKDMIITDENNYLIFCDDINTYEKYCIESNIEITSIPRSSLTNNGYGIELMEQANGEIRILYKLYSSQYPRSKELNIELHTIELDKEDEKIEQEGAWKIKINLPKDFYNREYNYYYVKDGSNQNFNINIEGVIVSNTQTIVKYNGKYNKYNNSIEGIEGQIENALDNNLSFYDRIWIENENGEKFELSAINDGYGTTYSPDGIYKGQLPFSLTKYDLTERIYLVIEKNKKMYIINLER